MGSKYEDLTGKRFERLVVLRKHSDCYVSKSGRIYQTPTYWCRCDCGKEKEVPWYALTSGNTKSCGCYNRELIMKLLDKMHDGSEERGRSHKRIYHIWNVMKHRCENPSNNRYKYYGGRGIRVCEEWKSSFRLFETWALSHGYADNLTIDRIDVNGDYCPENCRWTTQKVQQNNKTNNRRITYKGETKTLMEWSEFTGMPYGVLLRRFDGGWPVEKALSTKEKPYEHLITFNGKTMNLEEWSKETGIGRTALSNRFARGWSIEKALTTPPTYKYHPQKRKENVTTKAGENTP